MVQRQEYMQHKCGLLRGWKVGSIGLYIVNSYSSFDTQLDDPTFGNASLNHPVHILDRDNNNDVNGDANRS